MIRLLLLIGLILLVIGLLVRKLFCDPPLKKDQNLTATCNGGALARQLIEAFELRTWQVHSNERSALHLSTKTLYLAEQLAVSQQVIDLVVVARLVGLALIGDRDSQLLAWRLRALRFATFVPPLAMLVLIFSVLVMKLSVLAALVLWLWITLATVLLGLPGLWLELQSAILISRALHEGRMLGRGDTGTLLGQKARALCFRHALPPIFEVIWPLPIPKQNQKHLLIPTLKT